MSVAFHQELSALASNLLNGLRLLFFRRPSASHYSLHQIVLLAVLGALVTLSVDYLTNLPDPEFNLNALSGETLFLAGVLLVAYLVAGAMDDRSAGLRFAVQIYSTAPFTYTIGALSDYSRTWGGIFESWGMQWAVWAIITLWMTGIVTFILHGILRPRVLRTVLSVVTYVAVIFVLPTYLWMGEFWQPRWNEDTKPEMAKINQERLYYAQPGLIDATTRMLAPGRPGVTDLYFVGFGGYAHQDVFMKEVRYAQTVFDEHFDTRGRSVALINNPKTMDDVPLASGSNLARVLKRMGAKMNREEDVLFLFLTSHGSKKHELAADFWPLDLNDITPGDLKAALDEAGIKWRVLMVSACYSGGFIEPLKDENTLIATAAAPDKQSFGCGNESEFTYFGKAVLDEQLKTERYFPTAFAKAAESIKARESAEGKGGSEPRLFVGEAIASKLRSLERRLRADVKTASMD